MVDVALICMPIAPVERPSIGLSILKQSLKQANIKSKIIYSNIDFAKLIGLSSYQHLSTSSSEYNIFEWLFKPYAFPDYEGNDPLFLSKLKSLGVDLKWLMRTSQEIYPYLCSVRDSIVALQPKVVGCSSIFSQHCASIALLRILKEEMPHLITVMGGANVEGTMGLVLHQKCSFIDYIFLGESDDIFPKVMDAILVKEEELPEHLPHVLTPKDRQEEYKNCSLTSARITDMNHIGPPDYEDYFEQLKVASLDTYITPCLLIETSRGCWWGDKRPCSFCSLNGISNYYRLKDPQHILEEIALQSNRYNLTNFQAVDNVIGKEHLSTLLPELQKTPQEHYRFVYEVKPILTKDNLKLLMAAGITWVQAGIENLSDSLLRQLRKGSTCIRNIQFLKHATEVGLGVLWNYLLHLPKTSKTDIQEVLQLIPLIHHLQPPYIIPLRFDRFSHYFNNQSHYNIQLVPYWTYTFIYPFSEEELEDFAYFFENTIAYDQPLSQELIHALLTWNALFYINYDRRIPLDNRPVLHYYHTDDQSLAIEDTRACRTQDFHLLTGLSKDIYVHCHQSSTLDQLIAIIDIDREEICTILAQLIDHKLMIKRGHHYLSLAVNKTSPPLPLLSSYPGGRVQRPRHNAYTSLFDIK